MTHVVDDYKAWQPTFSAYDDWADPNERRKQAIMEMVGEAGEVLQVATKANRKDTNISRDKILDELGDTFWGLVGVMNEFNISWEELTSYNIEKLTERNT